MRFAQMVPWLAACLYNSQIPFFKLDIYHFRRFQRTIDFVNNIPSFDTLPSPSDGIGNGYGHVTRNFITYSPEDYINVGFIGGIVL